MLIRRYRYPACLGSCGTTWRGWIDETRASPDVPLAAPSEPWGSDTRYAPYHLPGWAGGELGQECTPLIAQVRALLRGRTPDGGMRLLGLCRGLARLRPYPHSLLGRLRALRLRLRAGTHPSLPKIANLTCGIHWVAVVYPVRGRVCMTAMSCSSRALALAAPEQQAALGHGSQGRL